MTNSRHRASLIALLVAAVALAACSDSASGPVDTRLAGKWTIEQANGATLPALIATTASGQEKLLGGTLVFADTTVADSVALAMYDGTGTPTAVRTQLTTPRYTSQENGLVLVTRHGAADLDYVDTAVVVGDTLRFKVHALGDAPAPVLLLYTRAVVP